MGEIEFRPATTADWAVLSKAITGVETCLVDGEPVAMGGLNVIDGRTWAFLDIKDGVSPKVGRAIIAALRTRLKGVNGPVFVQCDEHYQTAVRLLRVIGFRKTLYREGGKRVWKWQN